MILDGLVEFFLFLIEGAYYLFRFAGRSRRENLLLDQSPQERRARRRLGLGCLVILFLTALAIGIVIVAQ
jgi:hypothetical protein